MKNSSETFADKIIGFNRRMDCAGRLPAGFRVMNPYRDNPEAVEAMERFYRKYYGDRQGRRFIVGINPGRYGSGATGVPFTDTKRLESACGIRMESVRTHEVSSVFVYDMINAYGGPDAFYREFYVNSLFPLAIVRRAGDGKWVNANYYDSPTLIRATEDFMVRSLEEQVGFGLDVSEVFILGVKNAHYIEKLNDRTKLFGRLTVLEHPRFIQQYKSKEKQRYVDKYISAFKGASV